jgi:hypothetical protein
MVNFAGGVGATGYGGSGGGGSGQWLQATANQAAAMMQSQDPNLQAAGQTLQNDVTNVQTDMQNLQQAIQSGDPAAIQAARQKLHEDKHQLHKDKKAAKAANDSSSDPLVSVPDPNNPGGTMLVPQSQASGGGSSAMADPNGLGCGGQGYAGFGMAPGQNGYV